MTLQIAAKRACVMELDGPALKRWKPSQPVWAFEGVAPAAVSAAAAAVQAVVKVEEVPEPTSVLDLQCSPGRSCSSSGSLSSHPSLSGDETIHGVDISGSTEESAHHDRDIASWMECMDDPNGPLALADYANSDERVDRHHHAAGEVVTKLEVGGIDHFVSSADIDFESFELGLDGDDHGPFSMSAMLAADDPGLCLMDEAKFLQCFPDGFHDAHRLLTLDDSLSMMNSHGIGAGDAALQSSSGGHSVVVVPSDHEPPLDSGLQLVHLLLACAEAVDEADFDIARPLLSRLKAISDPYGDPMQRIALYFADALSSRLAVETVDSVPPLDSTTSTELAFQSFYEVLPFTKFTHFTANQAIFEAVGYRNKIHIVDLDVQQGLQWPSLLQTLSLRPGGPPHLKITAVGKNATTLELTKRRLTEFAFSLHVPFEFTFLVVDDLTSLDKDALRLASDEALAVNCSQVLHGLTSKEPALETLLRLIRSLNPEVVTLLEVEANHNGPTLMSRFVEALHYYCALFDALEGSLGRESSDRFLIENTTLFAEIKGIIAALEGGHARHVKSESWQRWFTKCGFRSTPVSSYGVQQAQLLLAYFVTGDATPYKLSESECGALIMGWQDTPVMAVSSWSCC